MRNRWSIAVVLSLCAVAAVAGVTFPVRNPMDDAIPGQKITIKLSGLSANDDVSAMLTDENGRQTPAPAKVTPDDSAVELTLPADLRIGRYSVLLRAGAPTPLDVPVPGELRVKPNLPKITGIAPEETAYSHSFFDPLFDFRITGDGFVPGMTSVITESGDVLAGPETCADTTKTPCVVVESPYVVHAKNVNRYRESAGPLQVGVRVGDGRLEVRSTDNKKLVLSRIPRKAIFAAAVILWIVLAVIVVATVSSIRGRLVGGKRYGIFSMFLLDNQTNTYSLSKLQLLLWSAVSVFAYVYLFLCQLLVQWKWEFPDVPEGLPLLLGISGGAAVTAAAVQNTRGAKGSGPVHPGPADFISSGGVVVAERFQFFVWTIVGVLGFLGLLLAADPAAISVLPKIPDQFLGLMGVSTLAYLGGKAVRSAGPVVRTVLVSKGTTKLEPGQEIAGQEAAGQEVETYEIRIDGENLENDAKFRLDDAAAPFTPVGKVDADPQGSNSNPKFSTRLKVRVRTSSDVGKALAMGTHTIEVVNADGQSGSGTFTIQAVEIDNVPEIKPNESQQTVEITGKNFVSGMTAKWTAPGETDAVQVDLTVKDETHASVNLTAKMAGTGTLVLVPPIGGLASAEVNVKEPPVTS